MVANDGTTVGAIVGETVGATDGGAVTAVTDGGGLDAGADEPQPANVSAATSAATAATVPRRGSSDEAVRNMSLPLPDRNAARGPLAEVLPNAPILSTCEDLSGTERVLWGFGIEGAYNFRCSSTKGVRPRATVPALSTRTEAQRWLEVRDDEGLWGDLRPELCEAVRVILETTMEAELVRPASGGPALERAASRPGLASPASRRPSVE